MRKEWQNPFVRKSLIVGKSEFCYNVFDEILE